MFERKIKRVQVKQNGTAYGQSDGHNFADRKICVENRDVSLFSSYTNLRYEVQQAVNCIQWKYE